MEAYQANSGGYAGEQPEPTGVYLGPAWLLACGLGAILGGFFMRGTSFSWPLMMLGVGVGLVGATMLYRNIMRVRRRRQALAAAGPGGNLGPAGGLPLAALQLPLTFAAAAGGGIAQAGRAGGGAGPRRVPPTYLVSLDRVGCPNQPEGKQQQQQMQLQQKGAPAAGSPRPDSQADTAAGTGAGAGLPAGSSSAPDGLGSCGHAVRLGALLPGPDFIALGVPLPKTWPPSLPQGAEKTDGRGDVESGRGRRGGGAGGGAAGPPCDVASRSGARRKPGGPGTGEEEGSADGVEGFVLVLQPEPQLLGFTAHIRREEDPPSSLDEQHPQPPQQLQQQLLLLRFPRRISYPDSDPDVDLDLDPEPAGAAGAWGRRHPADQRAGLTPVRDIQRTGSQGPQPQPQRTSGPREAEAAPQPPVQHLQGRRQVRRTSQTSELQIQLQPHQAQEQLQPTRSRSQRQQHHHQQQQQQQQRGAQRSRSFGARRAGSPPQVPPHHPTPGSLSAAAGASGPELQLPPLDDNNNNTLALALVLAPAADPRPRG